MLAARHLLNDETFEVVHEVKFVCGVSHLPDHLAPHLDDLFLVNLLVVNTLFELSPEAHAAVPMPTRRHRPVRRWRQRSSMILDTSNLGKKVQTRHLSASVRSSTLLTSWRCREWTSRNEMGRCCGEPLDRAGLSAAPRLMRAASLSARGVELATGSEGDGAGGTAADRRVLSAN